MLLYIYYVQVGVIWLDNRYLEIVVAEMQSILEEQNFAQKEEGVFANETKQIKIVYDDAKQIYRLVAADVTDGVVGEEREISAYLFDDSQTKRDAVSVGLDFVDTLKKELGIKKSRISNNANEVDLPTAKKNAQMNVEGFTAKLLAVYPEFKETYKASVAKNGMYLYLEFFRETLTPRICSALENGTDKQFKKILDLLNGCYIDGDKETCTLIIAILSVACVKDEGLFDKIYETLGKDAYLIPLVRNFIPEVKKNKQLREALIG
jgi:hypothetical protein